MVKKNILLHDILYALQGWLWIESMHLLIMIIQLDNCTHVSHCWQQLDGSMHLLIMIIQLDNYTHVSHCWQQLDAILLLLKFKNYRCIAYYR
jgi:hypothetical protein